MNRDLIFFRTSRYLRYRFIARNRKGHGIHSPFIFDLVTRVLRKKTAPEMVSKIEKVRERLKKDKSKLEMTDLGSGGRGNSHRTVKVSEVVRNSSVSPKFGRFLSNMAEEFGSPLRLELGTSAGISSMYMAASGDIKIVTVEGCDSIAELALLNFREAGFENITLLKSPFSDYMKVLPEIGVAPGLVFIDGDHRRKQLLEYFEAIMGICDTHSVIIIDDINYSPEMAEAWKEIKRNRNVSVTVDIYRMGIVFFRKGMTHDHYVISF